jgi:hypothetical protein
MEVVIEHYDKPIRLGIEVLTAAYTKELQWQIPKHYITAESCTRTCHKCHVNGQQL